VNRKIEDGREKDGGMGGEGKKGDFQKFEILTASTPLQCQLAPTCQISCRSVKPFQRYGRIWNFSRWRPSAILNFKKFKILTAHTLQRAKMHHRANFLQIGQGVAEIWPFSIFKDGGRPPSWIFKSWKF